MCDRWKKLAAPVLGIAVCWFSGTAFAGREFFSAYVLPPASQGPEQLFKMLQTGELGGTCGSAFSG